MSARLINHNEQELLHEIFASLEFSAYKHRHQKRKGAFGIPYINHPIEVTRFLLKHGEGISKDTLIAAVLHDTLEDTKTGEAEILEKFGSRVHSIVMEMSDDMRLPSGRRKQLQIEKAPHLSSEARAIKIADKACNIHDILFTRIKWTKSRKVAYIQWALKVVDQIGHSHPRMMSALNTIVEEAGRLLQTSFR